MTTTIVLVAIAFLVLLWALIAGRRRALRAMLLATGMETSGKATLVWPKGRRRSPRISVVYVDSDGVRRTVLKTVVSAGDGELVKKPVKVVFHPRRTNREEYVIVGFGASPSTWFRVTFMN